MGGTASGSAVLIAILATQAGPDPPAPGIVRIVLRLEKAGPTEARLTVENAAAARASVPGTTFAVVTTGEVESERRSHWARIQLSSVPRPNAPLELRPRAKTSTLIKLADLQWTEDPDGITPEQPLGRAVAPGAYQVQLQVHDPQGGWWRSNELQASIGLSGAVRYR